VDDMPIFRDPIAASLRLAGYGTVCAANGRDALVAARSARPAAILLDVAMPVMDGISFLRALRAEPDAALAKTPVILLTAMSDKRYVIDAGKLGVQDYLLKSAFSMRELLTRLVKYAKPPAGSGTKLAKPAAPAPPAGARIAPPAPALSLATPRPSASAPAPAAAAPVSAPAAAGFAIPTPPAAARHGSGPDPATGIPRLLTREQCLTRAEKAMEAKTLSGAVAEVVSLATSPRSNVGDLAPRIAPDAILAARGRQAANRAAFVSSRGVVSTIPDAVRQIGTSTVRQIAAALGIFDAMPASAPDGFNPVRRWQHSFAVAMLCERFAAQGSSGGKSAAAQAAVQVPPGIAYLVGLCHDLGDILFHTHFGGECAQVAEVVAATGKRQDDVERLMLGLTRGELVQTIVQRLGLPDSIKEPIGAFHGTTSAAGAGGGAGGASGALLKILKVADAYANGLLLAATNRATVWPLSKAECRSALGKDDPQPPDLTVFRSEVFYTTGVLARLSAAEAEEVMKPPFQRTALRVWVAREPSLSSLDPLTAALGSMASEVTAHDRLPGGPDAADADALVVLAPSDLTAGFTAPDIAKSLEAAGRPLPVLWLVARATCPFAPKLAQPVPAPTRFPVTLERLATFVATASQGGATAAAA
jgi:two-component system phosphate regulon response regulator PhoB